MRLNKTQKLIGENVILVPYEEHHVPKYHMWMTSEELQKLTASEPLTLEEEYQMQKSWREDEDKCTFIILDKKIYNQEFVEKDAMIGDTNIFITDQETKTGEIEIMIAEERARGKKLGLEAVIMMIQYGIEHIGLKNYEAKISLDNVISMKMFNKLGFQEKSFSEVFGEVTLGKMVDEKWTIELCEMFPFTIENY